MAKGNLITTIAAVYTVTSSILLLPTNAFSSTSKTVNSSSCTSSASTSLLSPTSISTIEKGGVAIEHNWLPPDLIQSLRSDAMDLFQNNQFRPDGLTNTAVSKSQQGFTSQADRQTFRGGADWNSNVGNKTARLEFANRMRSLRSELALGLNRPSLEKEGEVRHEMTYNWYEPGAKLGRHLDEHHEETKGTKGWMLPTRRSVTWLVYLNDNWTEQDGGALRCFPRQKEHWSDVPVGSHEGNLQVGWLRKKEPVFLDCFRESGGAALYRLSDNKEVRVLSSVDFDVPRQPIEFSKFLAPQYRNEFEQISTSRLDPRFASSVDSSSNTAASAATTSLPEEMVLDVVPAAGTLVLFDSVTLPHLVLEVTGKRQRIAATGWFHEDSQFVIEI